MRGSLRCISCWSHEVPRGVHVRVPQDLGVHRAPLPREDALVQPRAEVAVVVVFPPRGAAPRRRAALPAAAPRPARRVLQGNAPHLPPEAPQPQIPLHLAGLVHRDDDEDPGVRPQYAVHLPQVLHDRAGVVPVVTEHGVHDRLLQHHVVRVVREQQPVQCRVLVVCGDVAGPMSKAVLQNQVFGLYPYVIRGDGRKLVHVQAASVHELVLRTIRTRGGFEPNPSQEIPAISPAEEDLPGTDA
mmetsp:Transcript_64186/g.180673  ORF Transcript_64186/g.180673 Transcript_64186/m.180673 type:complete len:243 (-) Transcript_64186:255-983(-)